MAVRSAQLQDLAYVPSYNTLDTNLVNHVSNQVQQQSSRARQYGSDIQQDLQEQVLSTTTGLPEEFQSEAIGLVDESMRNIDNIFEQRGARGSMPAIQREAQSIQRRLQPYQQAAQQASSFRQRLQEDDIRDNVSASVRQLVESKGQFERDPDTGNVRFRSPDTKILDSWKDLDEVTRTMANEIEPFVTESLMQGQPVLGSDGNIMQVDGDVDAFFSRMKTKTMGYPDEPVQERVHQILMSRLINDPDIQEQLALQVEANGEEVTKENVMNEALRIVAPYVAAKATAEQTYSSPIQNPKFFASLNNGNASGNGVFTIPVNTVAGPLPYDNPIALNNEIESFEKAYDAELEQAIKEGVIERTSNGYNILKEGRYNSFYANKLQELNTQLERVRGRKSRLFTDALNAYHQDKGTEITEDNYESFMQNLSSDIEESNQAVSEIVREISRGGDVSDTLQYAARQANITSEELVKNIVNGQSLESMGLVDFIGNIPKAQKSVEKIRERFTNWHDKQLHKYSEEYQTYSRLLKEDAKGRTTTTNVIKTLDPDINSVGEQSFKSSLRFGDGADIRFFDIENAGQSIYEKYDKEKINNAIDTAEFEGYAYHPDDGRPIVVSTINIDGNQHTIQMDMSSDIISSMNLLSNDQAYKSHINNQINTIASNPDRRGKILVPTPFSKEPLQLSLSMPYRNTDSKGMPITSGSVPIELDLSRRGKRDVRKFRSPEELISFIMHQLPQMLSPKDETE